MSTWLVVLAAWLLGLFPPTQIDGLVPGYWEQTPLPQTGLATFYASGMMEHVLDVRAGHGQDLRCDECVGTVALLRAGDIGRKVWLQPPDGEKVGPFLVIDCARQEDVWPLVARNWVVDVSFEVGQLWAMDRPLDGVTVLADPADESYSGLADGPLRPPTPFAVSPDRVVLSVPTPTPAVWPTPSYPTPWPTRWPEALAPQTSTPAPGAEAPLSPPTPAGPPPPTPLTPVITTPTPLVRPPSPTPAAPGTAPTGPPPPTPQEVAVGRPGLELLQQPIPTRAASSTRAWPTVSPTPTPTLVRHPLPSGTSSPILPRTGTATPTPQPAGGFLDQLKGLLDRLRQ